MLCTQQNRSERESGHAEVLKVLERAVTNNLEVTPIELSNNEGGQSRVVALRQTLCTRRKSNCFLAANVGREVDGRTTCLSCGDVRSLDFDEEIRKREDLFTYDSSDAIHTLQYKDAC